MRYSKLLAVMVVVCAAALAGSVQAAQLPQGSITSTLEAQKASYEVTEPLAITFSLTNTTAEKLYLLRWQTPLDGVEADMFQVTRDGEPVPYTGRLYKRAEPVAEDYVAIAAGETLTTVIDISAAYDMSVRGQYTVRYQTVLEDVVADNSKALLTSTVASDAVSMWVEGWRDAADLEQDLAFEEYLAKKKPGGGGGGGGGQFTGCTTSQQNQLLTAKDNATVMVDRGVTDLDTHSYGSPSSIYSWWFGAATSSRYNTVGSHYDSLSSAFHTAYFTFDCTCNQNAYAYVYPTQPYKIYLCRVYWRAPATGRDSKAGTLVHETSHFNVVAGTNDYVYGATAAHNLALSNPNQAIDNADNHEYFAEDQ